MQTARPLLDAIEYPADLKKLPIQELPQVCQELRQYIVDVVSEKGGHFGASLGVVELTVAIHYVFNTPYDQLIWDVGHQAYAHKILTGRKKQFPTNREYGGLSGFPTRSESEYDAFGVGHASTSVSAALGMSIAAQYNNETDRRVVAVIGDGALTGGMALEALNYAGTSDSNALIIVNDNGMSIDPNVSAFKEYLVKIGASPSFNTARNNVKELLHKLSTHGPNVERIALKIEQSIKGTLFDQSNFFESMNLRYFGPVDGHNVELLVKTLQDIKEIPGIKVFHCLTRKGKGYKFSEEGDQTAWHSPGLFDKVTGEIKKSTATTPTPKKYQDVFGETMIELARKNPKIVAVTPAMLTGSSLTKMFREMPDRVFDVGIAEQHAVTFSAGLATRGLLPFCNIYSTFMQRAYDQVIHDVALQNLKVVFCLDRAGLVGTDGATHHGTYDIAYFRTIPNMVVSAPMNEEELRNLLYTAQLEETRGPMSIRYPRGQGVMTAENKPFESIPLGKGRKLRDGKDIAFLSLGTVGNTVANVCEALEKKGIKAAHYDLRFAKPLDENLLREALSTYGKIITVEDGCIMGGIGSAVLEFAADNGYHMTIRRMGIPDRFVEHGSVEELQKECGFDAKSLERTALRILGT